MPEDQILNARLYDFEVTAVGTSSGVTATQTAVTGEKFAVTSISCSGDAAALVTVESPASTILWQERFASAFTLNKDWDEPVIVGAKSAAILVKVSASTSHSEANIGGFAVPA